MSNIAILPLYAKKDLGTGQTDVTPLFFGKIVFFPFKKSMWEYEIKHFFKGGTTNLTSFPLPQKSKRGPSNGIFFTSTAVSLLSPNGAVKKSNRPIIF